jgi:hypothetical protein
MEGMNDAHFVLDSLMEICLLGWSLRQIVM